MGVTNAPLYNWFALNDSTRMSTLAVGYSRLRFPYFCEFQPLRHVQCRPNAADPTEFRDRGKNRGICIFIAEFPIFTGWNRGISDFCWLKSQNFRFLPTEIAEFTSPAFFSRNLHFCRIKSRNFKFFIAENRGVCNGRLSSFCALLQCCCI